MSLVTPLTRIVLLAAAGGIAYATVSAAMPNEPEAVESGYANPEYVELHKPKNENGNVELWLQYDNGTEKISLPIMAGQNGPVVGGSDYLWNSLEEETKAGYVSEGWAGLDPDLKSRLVSESWEQIGKQAKSDLVKKEWDFLEAPLKSELVSEGWHYVLSDTRKSILRTELDKMLENYGE